MAALLDTFTTPLRALWKGLTPPALLVLSFALLIAVGTAGLLWLPGLRAPGVHLSFVDALFTMTSAACVTGLNVVDTTRAFTRLGQAWILLFIQLGGLGLVTLTTLVIGVMGRRLSLRSEMIVGAPMDYTHRQNVVGLTLRVMRFTLAVELAGAGLLWVEFLPHFGAGEAAWHALFHAVSAFCNAGFSTFPTQLVGFSERPVVLLTVSALVVLGGVGYLAAEEWLRWWDSRRHRRNVRLSVHTWSVLWVSAALLLVGWALYALFEWQGVLRGMGAGDRLANALFMSVTARTAGFNSIPYAEVLNPTAFLTVLLMVVGGSPGSTAGGVKTTTLAVLAALAWARTRGRRHVSLHRRTIPPGTIERTVSLALVAFGVMTAGVFLLSWTESGGEGAEARAAFLPLFFEVVSAFCTVGLSMDVTPGLSTAGKALVALMMFVGRVGPTAFFAALSLGVNQQLRDVREAQEDLIIG